MLPLSGARNPATNDISVVLPAPFGPSNPKNSPRASESETRSKATISPKRFVTFSIVSIDAYSDSIPGIVFPVPAGLQVIRQLMCRMVEMHVIRDQHDPHNHTRKKYSAKSPL